MPVQKNGSSANLKIVVATAVSILVSILMCVGGWLYADQHARLVTVERDSRSYAADLRGVNTHLEHILTDLKDIVMEIRGHRLLDHSTKKNT